MTRLRHPAARRQDVVDQLFDHRIADPYRWLERGDSAETLEWLVAQDALRHSALDNVRGREWLRGRMEELLSLGVTGPPVWRGARRFFMRRRPGQEHAVLHVVDPDGTERVLLDPMALDATGRTTLDTWYPDREGRRLVYQVSSGGRRRKPAVRPGHRLGRSARRPDLPVPALPDRLAARRRVLLLRTTPARRRRTAR